MNALQEEAIADALRQLPPETGVDDLLSFLTARLMSQMRRDGIEPTGPPRAARRHPLNWLLGKLCEANGDTDADPPHAGYELRRLL